MSGRDQGLGGRGEGGKGLEPGLYMPLKAICASKILFSSSLI